VGQLHCVGAAWGGCGGAHARRRASVEAEFREVELGGRARALLSGGRRDPACAAGGWLSGPNCAARGPSVRPP